MKRLWIIFVSVFVASVVFDGKTAEAQKDHGLKPKIFSATKRARCTNSQCEFNTVYAALVQAGRKCSESSYNGIYGTVNRITTDQYYNSTGVFFARVSAYCVY